MEERKQVDLDDDNHKCNAEEAKEGGGGYISGFDAVFLLFFPRRVFGHSRVLPIIDIHFTTLTILVLFLAVCQMMQLFRHILLLNFTLRPYVCRSGRSKSCQRHVATLSATRVTRSRLGMRFEKCAAEFKELESTWFVFLYTGHGQVHKMTLIGSIQYSIVQYLRH